MQVLEVDNLHRSLTSDSLAFMQMSKVSTHKYSVKMIVTAVQTCTLLRDSGDLEKQLRLSVRMIMAEQEQELLQAIDRGLLRAPSASSVSRWRLAIEVGFMFFMRQMFAASADVAVRCLLTDSSPQRGFDWLLTETYTLAPADFEQWCRATWGLARTLQKATKLGRALEEDGGGHDVQQLQSDLDSVQQERLVLQTMLDTCSSVWGRPSQPPLDVHIHPPGALGSQRAQLVHKIHALLRVLLLEVGTWPAVSRYLATVRGVCTDFGTESGLADVQDIDVTDMFPWCAETCDFCSVEPEPLDDFQAPAHEDRPLQEYLVVRQQSAEDGGGIRVLLPRLFPLAMQVPLALHVLHHSVEELTDAFENYAEWFFPRLQATVNILKKKYYRERFVAQCLRGTKSLRKRFCAWS